MTSPTLRLPRPAECRDAHERRQPHPRQHRRCVDRHRGAGLERKHAGIKQVVYSPLGAHSEKPWEVRHRLELLYGDVPRIELFSRSAAPGWSHWGNQCATASVELIPGCAIDVVKTEAA